MNMKTHRCVLSMLYPLPSKRMHFTGVTTLYVVTRHENPTTDLKCHNKFTAQEDKVLSFTWKEGTAFP